MFKYFYKTCNNNLLKLTFRPLSTSNVYFKQKYSPVLDYSKGVYILLPDLPSDTTQNNPLLSLPNSDIDFKFSNIIPIKCFRNFVKNILTYEAILEELNYLDDQDLKFNQLIFALDSHLAKLDYSYSLALVLNSVNPSSFPDQLIYYFLKKYKEIRTNFYYHYGIYKKLKQFHNNSKLSPSEKYIIDRNISKFELGGITLKQNKIDKIKYHNELISKFSKEYVSNLNNFIARHYVLLTNNRIKSSLPDFLIPLISSTTGSKIRMHKFVVFPFLEYCFDPSLRSEVWDLYYSRCSLSKDPKLSNSILIEEIRSSRQKIANICGFKTFSEFSVQNKMIGSLDTIKNFLDLIKERIKLKLEKDINTISELGYKTKQLTKEKLQLCDYRYLRKQFLLNKYENKQDLYRYFPIEKVLQGLFITIKKLFDIEIEEVKGNFDLWSNDVKLFRIYHHNQFIGSFYFDIFQRHPYRNAQVGITQLIDVTNKCDLLNTKPLLIFFFNYCPPIDKDQPILLSFNQVINLFQMMGRIIQIVSNKSPFHETSALRHAEIDFNAWCSELMELWPIHDYETIQSCSSHIQNGNALSKKDHEAARNMIIELSSINLQFEIFKSALDLTLYSSKEFWGDITNELLNSYLNYFEQKSNKNIPCSFEEVITGNHPASYFTILWSKVIAADTYLAFKETDDVNSVAERYLNILSLGGEQPAGELFRNFRKRDPSIDPFLKLNKLTTE